MKLTDPPTFALERDLWQRCQRVAGVDEVGRGSLAGCVVAAAVILPPNLPEEALMGVRDSKQLSRQARVKALAQIRAVALGIRVGAATPAEIDQLNIRRATALAMQRALGQLDPVDHILVDGLRVPELSYPQTALVKGDTYCLSIAAASIVAKVSRDRWMGHFHHRYPDYGWDRNVGYGTPVHRQAIQTLGLTHHHRRSFTTKLQTPMPLLAELERD